MSAAATSGPGRWILHADADSFYVSVALRHRPELVDLPVAAVAFVFVASANYPARARGVRAGMPVQEAVRRCPDLVVLDVPRTEFEPVGDALFDLFVEYADAVEPGSVEEAFLDVGAATSAEASAVGHELRRRAATDIGVAVSVGVGRTKTMAKLASRAAKPDGLHVVEAEEEARIRASLPIGDVWGIGPRTTGRLAALGVAQLGDVDRIGDDVLLGACGPAMARRVRAIRDGTDDATVRSVRSRTTMSAEDSVAGYDRPDRTATDMVERCVGRVCHRAARAGLDASGITLTLLLAPDGTPATHRRSGLPQPADRRAWLPVALALLAELSPRPLVGLRITLTGLAPADRTPPTLF